MSRLAEKIKEAGTPYGTIFGPIHRLDLTPDEFAMVKAAPEMRDLLEMAATILWAKGANGEARKIDQFLEGLD